MLGSDPQGLGLDHGMGSETWFPRHAPGTLPRYSSLTRRRMFCVHLLLGEAWVHRAVAEGGGWGAWVGLPEWLRLLCPQNLLELRLQSGVQKEAQATVPC